MKEMLRFKKEVKKNTKLGVITLMETIVYGIKTGKTIIFDDNDIITMPRESFNKKGLVWKNSKHNNEITFTEYNVLQ